MTNVYIPAVSIRSSTIEVERESGLLNVLGSAMGGPRDDVTTRVTRTATLSIQVDHPMARCLMDAMSTHGTISWSHLDQNYEGFLTRVREESARTRMYGAELELELIVTRMEPMYNGEETVTAQLPRPELITRRTPIRENPTFGERIMPVPGGERMQYPATLKKNMTPTADNILARKKRALDL